MNAHVGAVNPECPERGRTRQPVAHLPLYGEDGTSRFRGKKWQYGIVERPTEVVTGAEGVIRHDRSWRAHRTHDNLLTAWKARWRAATPHAPPVRPHPRGSEGTVGGCQVREWDSRRERVPRTSPAPTSTPHADTKCSPKQNASKLEAGGGVPPA